ncbi:hypothetical protein ACFB49_26640 [Sphingomonas sp. DBB INV C78]|uniref:hypothetical protein n=1 Tax=Sphingomonas sp. DBB INV C78 TaxID=3349434 RepID=UPI0036D3B4A6
MGTDNRDQQNPGLETGRPGEDQQQERQFPGNRQQQNQRQDQERQDERPEDQDMNGDRPEDEGPEDN